MPNRGGHDYYVLYYNDEGEINVKRKRGQRAKPTATETLAFLERSLNRFKEKYGRVAKSITMSKEMKDMIDTRVTGKDFLKKKNIIIDNKNSLGLRAIHLSELQDGAE